MNMQDYPPQGIPVNWGEDYQLTHFWGYSDKNETQSHGYDARYESKSGNKKVISFFKCDEHGEWSFGFPDPESRPLYGLNTVRDDEPVYVVEGCKCAFALHLLGLPAVTSSNGSSSASRSDWTSISDVNEVIILPDNDASGLKYAEDVASILSSGANTTISIACLSGLESNGDIVDWIQQRLPDWDGYSELPLDAVDILREVLLEEIKKVRIIHEVPEQVEIEEKVDARPEYPIDALGSILGDITRVIAASKQAPLSLCANSVLGAASLAVQGRANVQMDGMQIATSLFLITIARSGERKSSTYNLALDPHRKIQQIWMKEFKEEERQFKIRHELWEKAKSNILRDTSKKYNKFDVGQKYDAQRADLEELGAEPEAPMRPILITGDPTIESLQRQVAEHYPYMGLITSEGAQFLGGFSLSNDNSVRTASALSSMWDGGELSVLRINRDPICCDDTRLTLHLMAQPDVAKAFVGDKRMKDQGILNRCLYSDAETLIGSRMYKSSHPQMTDAFKAFESRIFTIMERQKAFYREQIPKVESMSVTPEAKELWIDFFNECERESGKGRRYESMQGYTSKVGENCLRISGVLEIFDSKESLEISQKSMSNAIRLMRFYLAEAEHLLGAVETSSDANELWEWIRNKRSNPESPLTGTELAKNAPNKFRDKKTYVRLMQELESEGKAQLIPSKKGIRWKVSKDANTQRTQDSAA